MKRAILSLAAMTLVLGLAATVHAADSTATAPPAAAPAEQAPAAKPAAPHHKAAAHKASAAVDLNSATKEQLMGLGLDDATADKVIAARPFTSRAELLKKSLVTKEQYTKLRGKVTVKKAS